jgi:hypothetical protein
VRAVAWVVVNAVSMGLVVLLEKAFLMGVLVAGVCSFLLSPRMGFSLTRGRSVVVIACIGGSDVDGGGRMGDMVVILEW